MKKVIGLCLVLLISSVSVFAQDDKRGAKKGGDPAQRCEKMIADLKLDEKQAADFRKVEAEFRDKMKAERKQADLDRRKMREKMMSLRDDRDAEMKKTRSEGFQRSGLYDPVLEHASSLLVKDMVARNEKMTPVSYCLERESFFMGQEFIMFLLSGFSREP